MASAPETTTTLEGMFKQQYPDGLPDLIPNSALLQKSIKFVPKELELGDSYIQPVRMSYPNGFTHAAAGAGAFSLNDAKAGQLKKATVDGAQILLRDQVDMESAAKASKGSKKAFEDIVSITYEGLQKSMRKRVETLGFYGGSGLAVISSVSGSSTTRAWTLTAASFAPGMWSGLEGAELDVYLGTSATQVNTNATVVIVSVDIDSKILNVSGNATDLTAIAAADTLYFRGAYGAEMNGVHKILSNTGTLYGVSASTYSLWKASSVAVTGALSFNAIKKAVSKAVGKGLDEDAMVFVNPGGWDDIMTDIAALRRTDKSEVGKVIIGAKEIEFHSQNGMIKVLPSIFVKEGQALGLCNEGYWKRVGATDVSFSMPGFGDQLFFVLPSNAGIESRCYTHQTFFCDAPAKNFLITGIVNSTAV